MKQAIVGFLTSLIFLIAIDGVWLFIMAPRFYQKHIGHLISPTPHWPSAAAFYLLYAFGIYYLVVKQVLEHNYSLCQIFCMGAILGFVAYGTYDLTNQATLLNWPRIVTIVDLIWGSLLTATVAYLSSLTLSKFFST